jgi:chemotaxis protein MotA
LANLGTGCDCRGSTGAAFAAFCAAAGVGAALRPTSTPAVKTSELQDGNVTLKISFVAYYLSRTPPRVYCLTRLITRAGKNPGESPIFADMRKNMIAIIGIIVVFGAVVAGYLMEKGNMLVLLQPAELVIIGGAALGTILIANPLHILKSIIGGITEVIKGSKYTSQRYLDSLKMLYDLLNGARRGGLAAIENDFEQPENSKIFSAYPAIAKSPHVLHFICDTLRTASIGTIEPFDLDQMMELDMDVHHHETSLPITALSTTADSLPGLGIVAAVLGVVVTMGALGGPPEEIGHKVAAALVGTFLGILLCYGLLGPIASHMAKLADDEKSYFNVLRVCITSFVKGNPPILAVEMARRAVPGRVRPTYHALESLCRAKDSQAVAA